ncbi:MAG: bifunctional DNA-formamidopyrimidine glycosylase/DNA-(apurinic or apyrimidinic site) lyase [Nanoarchaeota archaeon]
MPELPEVETIVQQLNKKVLHKKIVKVEILDHSFVDSKVKNLVNNPIKKIWRRAKYIFFEIGNSFLLVHLGMTGHFHYVSKSKEAELKSCEKFIMFKFHLNDGSVLTHNSVRKFGQIKVLDEKKLQQKLDSLGIEPLSKEFTLELFTEMLARKKKSTLKTLLMDQNFIAGLGNIYAQEAMHHASIGPLRKAGDLSGAEIKKLYSSIQKILESAIEHHGTTVESYVHIEGSGGYQKYLTVYGKKQCPKGHPVKKIFLGGRGTYYCTKCQK